MTSLWRLSIDYMYQFTKPLIGGNMLIFNIIPIKWHRCNFVWWQLISKRLFFNREIVGEMLWAKKSPLKLMIITAFDIYWDIKFSNRSEIWWALWQQCCRDISSIWVMCCSQYAVMHRIYIYIYIYFNSQNIIKKTLYLLCGCVVVSELCLYSCGQCVCVGSQLQCVCGVRQVPGLGIQHGRTVVVQPDTIGLKEVCLQKALKH